MVSLVLFFENGQKWAITAISERYERMLSDYIWRGNENNNPEDMFFQQDGATNYTAATNRALLQKKFAGSVISK